MNDYLYPLYEAHVRLTCDGNAIHVDGLAQGPDSLSLPEFYRTGLFATYHILEAMLPYLLCISVMGIWSQKVENKEAPFCAFDLWIQCNEEEGFYLPMASAASLFSDNGIPYFHQPLI